MECNRAFAKEWKSIPFLKRIFKPYDVYHLYYRQLQYVSYDGKAPMRRVGFRPLNPESYPDAKYEMRYVLAILGRNVHLYFNIIPGIAKEHQFGTIMSEKTIVSCITIKANAKSNIRWKQEQAKFLEILIPIIEELNKKMKWGHRIGDLFFNINLC